MIKQIAAKSFLLLFFMFIPLVAVSGVTHAAVASGCSNAFLGLPTWYQYLEVEKDDQGACFINTDATKGSTVVLIIMGLFDIVLFLAGMLAVIMVIYGGFRLVTSTGEPQKIAAARVTILNALVGLGIAILASQVVGFIAGKLG